MRFQLRRFRLTKAVPLAISRGTITAVEHLLLELEHEGLIGLGETGGFDAGHRRYETEALEAELAAALPRLQGLEPEPLQAHEPLLASLSPPARCAVDLALLDWQGKRLGLPLQRLWGLDSGQANATSVTLGLGAVPQVLERLERWWQQLPASRIKLKLGSPAGLEHDQALLEAYLPYLRKRNYEPAVMIVHANRHNQQINMAIRQQLWGANTPLRPGELLQVVQNSYLVPLSNGDQVIVEDITPDQRVAGFQFAKMKLRKAGDNQVYETMVMLDLLHKDDPALSKRDTQTLLIDFDIRCRKKNINRKSILYNQLLRSDPYLNALRVKYGYATTCHKAQGGEWPQVFLNIGSTIFALSDNARYRWFYTAITRASQHLHVNDGYWVEGFNQRQPR